MRRVYLICSLVAAVLMVDPEAFGSMLFLFGNLLFAAWLNGCFEREK